MVAIHEEEKCPQYSIKHLLVPLNLTMHGFPPAVDKLLTNQKNLLPSGYSLVEIHWCFRGKYCPYLRVEE
jgi:hypothetical protein